MTTPTIVSGAVSTVTELGKDEAWLQGWLKEQPARLGLGELSVTDGASDEDDERSFSATDDERCFTVDVQLGEMEASRGFGVLDNWARNRVRYPDKTHVAALVTEAIDDRYRTTLETLAEHLPLVVVELQVWRGDAEAIIVPHVALSSDEVDLSSTVAGKAAEAVARAAAAETTDEADSESESADDAEAVEAEAESTDDTTAEVPEDKDDTGVADPWGMPAEESEEVAEVAVAAEKSNGHRLLTKIGV
jgi:hypothetical protein